ncbi:MAG: TonB-dependent receptor, partial [Rhodothermales bacterium]|nr:TonB-dependent receptor [Rhodothermales bacterium]
MYKIVLKAIVLCLLVPSVALGQSTTDSLYTLPELTVVATRFEVPRDQLPARVTRIDGELAQQMGARSLGEVLEQLGAGFIRRLGPAGLAGVSFRGAGPSQTALLVDGQRLSDPQLGQVDLSLLPTILVSSIDLLHGGGASRFGSDAVAGAINIETVERREPGLQLTTIAGAFGERSISAVGAVGLGAGTLTVGTELSSENGDFSFTDRSTFPTRRTSRSNADRQSVSAYAKLRRDGERSETRIAAWVLAAERGLPTVAGGAATGERQFDEIVRVWTSHARSFARGSLQLQASAQRSSIRYLNPLLGVDDTGVTRSMVLDASHGVLMTERTWIRVASDLSLQSADHPSLGSSASQVGAAPYVTGSVAVIDGFVMYPSLRYDFLLRDGGVTGALSPSLRVRVERKEFSPVAIKAGVERTFRSPTFNDLFWKGAGAEGDPGLVPEEGLSADVGLHSRVGGLRLEMTAFYQSVTNRIMWLPGTDGTWRPQNVGRTSSVGVEASASGAFRFWRAKGRLFTGYELVRARDRSDPASQTFGQPLRYVPEHTLRSNLALDVGRLSAGFTMRFVGRRY